MLKGLASDPPIIGPDGTLYGFLNSGARDRRLAAVSRAGRIRWTADASLPAWWSAESPDPYPVLAPDGSVYFGGGACRQPAFVAIDRAQHMGSDGCVTTVGPDGRLRWHVAARGLTKGGPSLLVEADGTLVRATLGPSSGFVSGADDARRNLTLFAPDGSTRRWGAGCSWVNNAAGAGGRLYAIAASHPGGPCPGYTVDHSPKGQDGQSESAVAFTATGTRAWMTPLPVGCAASTLTADLQRGEIYVAALCGRHGERGHTRVFAVNARGHLLWMTEGDRSDGQPALALDRASGDVRMADTGVLRRISPAGVTRWQRTWRATFAYKMTLVLDARDTAYVCGADGLLRTINMDGRVLWQYRFTAPRNGFIGYPPSAALGPDGTLYVASEGEPGIVVFAP